MAWCLVLTCILMLISYAHGDCSSCTYKTFNYMFTNNSYYNPSTNTNTANGGNIGKIDASTTTYDSNGCAHIKMLCYAHCMIQTNPYCTATMQFNKHGQGQPYTLVPDSTCGNYQNISCYYQSFTCLNGVWHLDHLNIPIYNIECMNCYYFNSPATTCSSAPSRTSPITTTIQTTTYQNRVNTETYESVLVMNSQLRKQIMTLEVERNNYRRQAHECQGKLGLEADQRRQAEAEVKILNAEVDKNLRMLSEMTVNSAVPSSFFDLFLNKYH